MYGAKNCSITDTKQTSKEAITLEADISIHYPRSVYCVLYSKEFPGGLWETPYKNMSYTAEYTTGLDGFFSVSDF